MGGWGNTPDLAFKTLLGLIFSVMLAYASKLLMELQAHERGREALIAQRTGSIGDVSRKLDAALGDASAAGD